MIFRLGFRQISFCMFLLGLALQLPAAARELEPDATLEGFPFSSPSSVAISADGRDVYAGGGRFGSPTPGFAWLRREPSTGALTFKRNHLSDEPETMVLALALSPDQLHLYVLTPARILLFGRAVDGTLSSFGAETLPAGFRGTDFELSPLGDRLLVFGRPVAHGPAELRAYGRSLSGALGLQQSLTGAAGGGAFLGNDLFVSGGILLRRSGGAWAAENIAALGEVRVIGDVLVSPDRRYAYLLGITGEFPHTDTEIFSLEMVGGQPLLAGRSEFSTNFELDITSLAINPASGDLYVASYDTNGGAAARIYHYRVADGGRIFAQAETLFDPNREYLGITGKDSLAFSADGGQLYTNFGGEPMALLAVDPAAGTLRYLPGAAGDHSYFDRPFKIVPTAFGHHYALTPNAILKLRWDGENVDLLSSRKVEAGGSGSARPPAIQDLVLTAGGGAGVLARGGYSVTIVERDRDDGELRLLEGTTLPVPGGIRHLAISPDGRYVYALGYGAISVFYLRRDTSTLVPVQVVPRGGHWLRLSDDGTKAMTVDAFGEHTFFERSVETGELTLAFFDYRGAETLKIHDAAFSRQGRLLYLFRAESFGASPRIEVVARQADGSWTTAQVLPVAHLEAGWQAVDATGSSLYRLSSAGLELSSLVGPAGLAKVAQLGPAELGGVGARMHKSFGENLSPLAVLENEGGLLMANEETGNLRFFRRGCGSRLAAGACLQRSRFRVEVDYLENDGDVWPAQALEIGSGDAQVYTFFDESNWEMMVKVLDGCALNGRFWVYAAASTDVGFEIRVADTWTGQRKTFRSAAGTPAPAITDGDAFATCSAADPGWDPEPPPRTPLHAGDGLVLDNRFEAEVSWTNHQGLPGRATGLQAAGTVRSGLFYFFSPDNWEMQVKVLNGCGLNDHYWVLGAATTDVGYELEVFDPVSGLTRTYDNIAGRASPAIIDLEAFPCN
jgi:DNA-binding beta-propeller fold protein YncE